MPPGNTLLVVISRSLWECHMNAKPRSLAGLACVLEGWREVQPAFALAGPGVAEVGALARRDASGARYGVPPNEAPCAKSVGVGKRAVPRLGDDSERRTPRELVGG